MSITTVQAGIALIEETLRQGGSFEIKTKAGPGTFNKDWTALQMYRNVIIEIELLKLGLVHMVLNLWLRGLYRRVLMLMPRTRLAFLVFWKLVIGVSSISSSR